MKQGIRKGKQLVCFLIVVCMLSSLGGCSKKKNALLSETVVTFDGVDYTLQDIMYYIYIMESNCSELQAYGGLTGDDFWEEVDSDSGMTTMESAKESVIDTVKFVHVYYNKALEAKYSLTEEQAEEVSEEVATIMDSLSDEYKKKTGFTTENLNDAVTKYNTANYYYSDQVELTEVDEDELLREYDYETYRQYDIEYLYFTTIDYDSNGNQIDMSKEDAAKVKKIAEDVMKEVQNGKDFETIFENSGDFEYLQTTITKDEVVIDENVVAAAMTLDNDQVYDGVIKGQDGYYIIKMMNNENREAYDEEISQVLLAAKEEAYSSEYDKLLEAVTEEINDTVWDKVELGEYALEETAAPEVEEETEPLE